MKEKLFGRLCGCCQSFHQKGPGQPLDSGICNRFPPQMFYDPGIPGIRCEFPIVIKLGGCREFLQRSKVDCIERGTGFTLEEGVPEELMKKAPKKAPKKADEPIYSFNRMSPLIKGSRRLNTFAQGLLAAKPELNIIGAALIEVSDDGEAEGDEGDEYYKVYWDDQDDLESGKEVIAEEAFSYMFDPNGQQFISPRSYRNKYR